jgi:hypothetical protein
MVNSYDTAKDGLASSVVVDPLSQLRLINHLCSKYRDTLIHSLCTTPKHTLHILSLMSQIIMQV